MSIHVQGDRASPAGESRRTLGVILGGGLGVAVLLALAMGGASSSTGSQASAPTMPSAPRATIAAEVLGDPSKFVALERMGKEQMDAILKDPDTARYRDVVAAAPPAAKGSVTFCGHVNAKNSFGGYGGYTRFIAAPNVGAWLSNSPGIRFREVWRDICQDRYVIGKAEFVN